MKKFILGFISILFICCAAFGAACLSACGKKDEGGAGHGSLAEYAAYTQDIDYRFGITSEEDSPSGNINESRIYADYDLTQGSTYFIVLDLKFYNFNWAGEGFEIKMLMREPKEVSVTLHEANTSDYDEQTDGDFYTITTRYKVPQNREEEKSYRVVYEVVAGDSGIAVNMEVDGLGKSLTFGVDYDLFMAPNEDNISYMVTGPRDRLARTIVVPEYYGAYPVTSVKGGAFGDTNGADLYLPKTIQFMTEVEEGQGIAGLGNIYITDLEAWCKIDFAEDFSNPMLNYGNLYLNGELLETLDIPQGITEIKDSAFIGFKGTAINIPDGVTSIGYKAFYQCYNLQEMVIPKSVTEIKYGAFRYTTIESLTFSDDSNLTTIGESAFDYCTSLVSVNFGNNSKLESLDRGVFWNDKKLSEVNFGENSVLTSIGDDVFRNCSALESVDIPASVNYIGWRAFKGCEKLKRVTIGNTTGWQAGATRVSVDNPALNAQNLAWTYCDTYYKRYDD